MAKTYINIKNRSYLFGDFDNDGTKNIDDKYPFNNKRKGKAREISLAKELNEYRKAAKAYKRETIKINKYFKAKGFQTKYRVKDVNSIINKLRRKRLNTVQDIGGMTILTKSPQESYDAAKIVRQNFKIVARDDYYKQPIDTFYRAIHYVVMSGGKFIEIQIKTKKESKIHLRAHTKYKEGKMDKQYKNQLHNEVHAIKY